MSPLRPLGRKYDRSECLGGWVGRLSRHPRVVVHVVLMVVIVVVVVVVCAAHSFTPTPFLYAHPSDHYFPAYFNSLQWIE